MDADTCACSGKSLGRLVQPAILALLSTEPVHGYLLVQRLAEMEMFRCQPPDPTGVYRMLRLMQEGGLVVCTWDLVDVGPAKRRFELTSDGKECLAQWSDTLQQYSRAIDDLRATIQRARSERQPAL